MTATGPAAAAESGPPPAPFRCASAARDRHDPQLGTAPQTRRWLLLEHRGPWQIDALAGSRLKPDVLELLTRTAQAQSARPLLIRRPGRSEARSEQSWAVVYENGAVLWGRWRWDDDLRGAADALAASPPEPDRVPAPLLLVCAHGLHDVCCALRGRPVAAALAAEWPEATWECSHVGGDRFAANLVVLPDGVYYGNLNAASAVDVVQGHLAGEVAVEHLRGMTRVPPPAQVAVAEVHRRYGPFAAGDVEVAVIDHASNGSWRIELTTPGAASAVTVTIAATRRRPAQLTCRAPGDTPAMEYHVVEVTTRR